MKDFFRRAGVILVCATLGAYLVTLFNQQMMIVQPQFAAYNLFVYVVLALFLLYILVIYGIYPIQVPMIKRSFGVFGIIVIFAAHVFLLNDATQQIFVGDLVKVFGVLMLVLGATGVVVTDKVKKKKAESKIQIIEA